MGDLLKQGILAFQAGRKEQARRIFLTAVMKTPGSERAWECLYDAANDDSERLGCLERILRINPDNEKAKSLVNVRCNPGGMGSGSGAGAAPWQFIPSGETSEGHLFQASASSGLPAGGRVIRINLVQVWASYIFGMALSALGVWQIINARGSWSDGLLWGGTLAAVGVYLLGDTLTAVQKIILTPENMLLVGNFDKQELTHNQIRDINYSTIRHRGGLKTRVVVIVTVEGDSIFLNRMGGAERLYGTLTTWWDGPDPSLYAGLVKD
jgi:hypothetical protein